MRSPLRLFLEQHRTHLCVCVCVSPRWEVQCGKHPKTRRWTNLQEIRIVAIQQFYSLAQVFLLFHFHPDEPLFVPRIHANEFLSACFRKGRDYMIQQLLPKKNKSKRERGGSATQQQQLRPSYSVSRMLFLSCHRKHVSP